MDPATIMMLISMLGKGVSGVMNNQGGSTKLKKKSNYDESQQNVYDMISNAIQGKGGGGTFGEGWNQLLEQMQGGGEAYEKFAAPMQREFEEETLPGIAER